METISSTKDWIIKPTKYSNVMVYLEMSDTTAEDMHGRLHRYIYYDRLICFSKNDGCVFKELNINSHIREYLRSVS